LNNVSKILSDTTQVEEISRTVIQIGELLSKSGNLGKHTSTYNSDTRVDAHNYVSVDIVAANGACINVVLQQSSIQYVLDTSTNQESRMFFENILDS
jgi:hypothetical protein